MDSGEPVEMANRRLRIKLDIVGKAGVRCEGKCQQVALSAKRNRAEDLSSMWADTFNNMLTSI